MSEPNIVRALRSRPLSLSLKAAVVASLMALGALGVLLSGGQSSAEGPLPDEQINITIEDSKVPGMTLPGTCWQIFYIDEGPPLQNVVFDVVGDNTKACAGSVGILSDKDPAVGVISITISGKLRAEFGDEWHVLQTQAPLKYSLDLIKRECHLDEGKCEFLVTNTLAQGDILVNVTDNVTGDPVAGQCVDVLTPDQTETVMKRCDGGPQDKDPGPGIQFNIPFGEYHVVLQPDNIPADRVLKEPSKVECTVANEPIEDRECKAAFALNAPTPTPTPEEPPPVGGISLDPELPASPAAAETRSGGNDWMLIALAAGAGAFTLAGTVWTRRLLAAR